MHETTIRVQFFDTDKMQVMHHANYVRYFETARTECLRSEGISYSEMEKEDFQMPVLSVNVKYKEPAFYDELVVISCKISKLSHASMEIQYEMRSKETGRILATGSSRHGFTNRDLRPIPLKKKLPHIYEIFQKIYEDGGE